jgi:hypothetical protein
MQWLELENIIIHLLMQFSFDQIFIRDVRIKLRKLGSKINLTPISVYKINLQEFISQIFDAIHDNLDNCQEFLEENDKIELGLP